MMMPSVMGVRKLAKLGVALATRQPHPFSVTFILTHRCNFQCEYCDIPASAADEMSTAEFCAAIDELADAGMARASFSGGEALVRRDAIEIIRHAKKRGLFTSLNSNGWMTVDVLDELAECLDMLVVSLDGPRDVHDQVRHRKGSYDRVLRALQGAASRGISTATISVLGPWNIDRIDDILGLAREHGFWSYFQPAYSDCFDFQAGLNTTFDPKLFDRIADHLLGSIKQGLPVGSSPRFFERLRQGPRFGDCSDCAAGRYFGTVLPEGKVVPCHLTSRHGPYLNGREVGFRRAFFEMPHPKSGPGCAISPYQETDLIFSLDARAITTALRRMSWRNG